MTEPANARAAHGVPDIVIITGMSGAGRSTAANALEDLGWYVVDNLPPALLPTMLDLADRASLPGVAAIIDARSAGFSTDLKSAIAALAARGVSPQVVFLEASERTLVQRFENVRRPHPMQGNGRVTDGIAAERELLQGVRGEADLVLDSSRLNVHELRARMRDTFGGDADTALRVNVVSFGFKYGLPVDADMVADCRFLPNPHWVPELAPMTGQDDEVSEGNPLLSGPLVEGALDGLQDFEHLRQLCRRVDLPVLLRSQADARAIGAAALVGATEGRRRPPRD